MTPIEADVIMAIGSLVLPGIGAYLGAYFKKKGENLATHEDITKLVGQVSAVTTTTSRIEATVSNEMWQRQTVRNEKREAYFQVLKILGKMRYAVDTLRPAPISRQVREQL